jgi:hypothetical protein
MRDGFEGNESSYFSFLEDNAPSILTTASQADRVLEQLGEQMAEDLVDSLTELTSPPNAPTTVAKKGFDDPLIETGQLRNAIDWDLRG